MHFVFTVWNKGTQKKKKLDSELEQWTPLSTHGLRQCYCYLLYFSDPSCHEQTITASSSLFCLLPCWDNTNMPTQKVSEKRNSRKERKGTFKRLTLLRPELSLSNCNSPYSEAKPFINVFRHTHKESGHRPDDQDLFASSIKILQRMKQLSCPERWMLWQPANAPQRTETCVPIQGRMLQRLHLKTDYVTVEQLSWATKDPVGGFNVAQHILRFTVCW